MYEDQDLMVSVLRDMTRSEVETLRDLDLICQKVHFPNRSLHGLKTCRWRPGAAVGFDQLTWIMVPESSSSVDFIDLELINNRL